MFHLLAAILITIFLIIISGVLFRTLHHQTYIMKLAMRFLKGHSKMNTMFICASCICSMVITGSLIAGDSLRVSITHAAYANLGEVDEVITSDSIFNESLMDRISMDKELMEQVDHVAPLLLFHGFAENPSTGTIMRDTGIIGFDGSFLAFGGLMSPRGEQTGYDLQQNEIIVNRKLADEIGIEKGDRINISFSRPDVSYEAIFLGDNRYSNVNIQFVVQDIVDNTGLGRFQLNANRKIPGNIYIPLNTLQSFLSDPDSINTILVSNNGNERNGLGSSDMVTRFLERALDDTLGHRDVGLQIRESPNSNYIVLDTTSVFLSYDYYELLETDLEMNNGNNVSPILTYFWNSLESEEDSVPYSTVMALDLEQDRIFGDLTSNTSHELLRNDLHGNEILINSWTAEQLQVGIGDTLNMNYSMMDDRYTIQYFRKNFVVKDVVQMEGKASDPMSMPLIPGIQERTSVLDWDPPFPLDLSRISQEDEDYWIEYGGTPKGFVSLETAQKLWGTDIGNLTQIRIAPTNGSDLSDLTHLLETLLDEYIDMEKGFISVVKVKQDALDSADGTELFTQMFLAFSGSCVIASLILLILLSTMDIDTRHMEITLLRTCGFGRQVIRKILMTERTLLTLMGGTLGIILGIVFGAFIVRGLNTIWSPAVEGSSIRYSINMDHLFIGFISGFIISNAFFLAALRYQGKRNIIRSLHFNATPVEASKLSLFLKKTSFLGIRFKELLGFGIFILALGIIQMNSDDRSVFIVFFATGFLMLSGLIILFSSIMDRIQGSKFLGAGNHSGHPIQAGAPKKWLLVFAFRNAVRDHRRTMSTVILFALTSFLLVSLTVNIQGVMYDHDRVVREGGGGYQIMAESSNPVFADLGSEQSRKEAGIDSYILRDLGVEQFRTNGNLGGTCTNLNRNADPRIIGANNTFLHDNSFHFIDHVSLKGFANPWDLLKIRMNNNPGNAVIPVVGDYNTIIWILGLDVDSTLHIENENGEIVDLRIVGIIGNSIFGGSLIMWDGFFDTLFPTNQGYSLFLFRSEDEDLTSQINEMEYDLKAYGLDAYTVESVVIENIEIENTYIAIFQVLLIFGVIMGTLGVGLVVWRNMIEREWEMGILRAIGFSRRLLMKSILLENSCIVSGGILLGTISGLIISGIFLFRLQIGLTTWPWLHVVAVVCLSFSIAHIAIIVPIFHHMTKSISTTLQIHE